MTDYEIVSLFFQIVETAQAALANYLTVVFGMLVASYLAAHKLDRSMAILVVTLFSIISIGYMSELHALYADFGRLGMVLTEKDPTGDLGWHGAVIAGEPGILPNIRFIILTQTVLAYLGTLWFFVHRRRRSE